MNGEDRHQNEVQDASVDVVRHILHRDVILHVVSSSYVHNILLGADCMIIYTSFGIVLKDTPKVTEVSPGQ